MYRVMYIYRIISCAAIWTKTIPVHPAPLFITILSTAIICYLCFICSFDSFSRSFSSFSFVSWRNGSTRVLETRSLCVTDRSEASGNSEVGRRAFNSSFSFWAAKTFSCSWNEKKQKRSGLAKLILNFSKILEVWWGWMFATVPTHFPQWWLLSLAKAMPRIDCMVLTLKPVSVVNVIITLKPANLVSPKSIHMAHVARNLQMFENFIARQPSLKFCIFIFQSFQTVLSVIENAQECRIFRSSICVAVLKEGDLLIELQPCDNNTRVSHLCILTKRHPNMSRISKYDQNRLGMRCSMNLCDTCMIITNVEKVCFRVS